jgi:hypothetical protein
MSTQLAAERPRLLQQLWNLLVAPLVPAILLLALALPLPQAALAGPVDWHEVTATAEGRQWWDAGSLRLNRDGNLSVLSRFQPAADEAEGQRPPASDLYVMEVDCGQSLFRDTSINGIPQWGSHWQPVGADGLIEETLAAVCAAGSDLLAGS